MSIPLNLKKGNTIQSVYGTNLCRKCEGPKHFIKDFPMHKLEEYVKLGEDENK